MQDLEPSWLYPRAEHSHSGGIAAGTVDAGDNAVFDRIAAD